MPIDVDKLRGRLKGQLAAPAIGIRFPGAFAELSRVDSLSEDDLIELAERMGIDPADFEIPDSTSRWF